MSMWSSVRRTLVALGVVVLLSSACSSGQSGASGSTGSTGNAPEVDVRHQRVAQVERCAPSRSPRCVPPRPLDRLDGVPAPLRPDPRIFVLPEVTPGDRTLGHAMPRVRPLVPGPVPMPRWWTEEGVLVSDPPESR